MASNNSRVVLISGSNRGIGAAVAQALHDEGWRASLGMREPRRPDWVWDESTIHLHAYDALAHAERDWVSAAAEHFGRIDAVVANAGVMVPKSVIDVEEGELDAMLEVNVKAPRRLAKAAWPALAASGSGRVVVVASLSGKRVASAGSGAYSMTKHAAVALAHGLRHSGWEHGIRATAVCPGFVATDMARAITDTADAAMTQPGDVARLVSLALNMPNAASVAELHVNCADGEQY